MLVAPVHQLFAYGSTSMVPGLSQSQQNNNMLVYYCSHFTATHLYCFAWQSNCLVGSTLLWQSKSIVRLNTSHLVIYNTNCVKVYVSFLYLGEPPQVLKQTLTKIVVVLYKNTHTKREHLAEINFY